MDIAPRRIQKYITPEGRCPFDDWRFQLHDRKARAIIDARLLRVMQGNLGDWKFVGDGVRELRIDFGPGYRLYFAEDGKTLIILLSGGSKSTQAKDIKAAQNHWSEYRS